MAVAFPASKDPGDAYLHQALEQFDHLANEDVEMKAPLSELAVFLVLDTNILLHHFEVLAQFVADVEKQSLPVIVIVPGAVIYELDGQKKHPDLAWFARRATAWLLTKIKERRSVKGQAHEETCKSTRNWKIKEPGERSLDSMYNDNLILDCCLYFKRERPTALFSADNNLCISCQTQGILSITPSRYGSSQDIARSIYGDNMDLGHFKGYKESYQSADTRKVVLTTTDDDDSMAVDDEGSLNARTSPQHPISMLHEAIIDHFARLLVELVGKVGGDEVRQWTTPEEEAQMSRYATRRRPYTEWSAAECVEFLVSRAQPPIKIRHPRPEVFLLKAYTRGVPGSRTGREWSRRDWEVAMENLEAISRGWNDASIRESVHTLEPHIEHVFSLPLRGT